MGRGRKLALSAAIAIVIFASLAFAWRYTGPAYGEMVVLMARQMGSGAASIDSDGLDVVIRYLGQIPDVTTRWRILGLTLHYGPLLLTALILATPACGWQCKAMA